MVSVVQECEYKMKENKGVAVGLLFIACIIVLVCCVNSQSVTTNSDLKLFEKYNDYEVVTARLLGSSKGYENETPAPYGYRVGEKSYEVTLGYTGKSCKILVSKEDPQNVKLKSEYDNDTKASIGLGLILFIIFAGLFYICTSL